MWSHLQPYFRTQGIWLIGLFVLITVLCLFTGRWGGAIASAVAVLVIAGLLTLWDRSRGKSAPHA